MSLENWQSKTFETRRAMDEWIIANRRRYRIRPDVGMLAVSFAPFRRVKSQSASGNQVIGRHYQLAADDARDLAHVMG